MAQPNPFLVLDVPEDANDATIRKAYLDLVRRYPPETAPEQFQLVADAYRAIASQVERTELLLLGHSRGDHEPLEELAPPAASARRSVGIDRWLKLLGEARRAR